MANASFSKEHWIHRGTQDKLSHAIRQCETDLGDPGNRHVQIVRDWKSFFPTLSVFDRPAVQLRVELMSTFEQYNPIDKSSGNILENVTTLRTKWTNKKGAKVYNDLERMRAMTDVTFIQRKELEGVWVMSWLWVWVNFSSGDYIEDGVLQLKIPIWMQNLLFHW